MKTGDRRRHGHEPAVPVQGSRPGPRRAGSGRRGVWSSDTPYRAAAGFSPGNATPNTISRRTGARTDRGRCLCWDAGDRGMVVPGRGSLVVAGRPVTARDVGGRSPAVTGPGPQVAAAQLMVGTGGRWVLRFGRGRSEASPLVQRSSAARAVATPGSPITAFGPCRPSRRRCASRGGCLVLRAPSRASARLRER